MKKQTIFQLILLTAFLFGCQLPFIHADVKLKNIFTDNMVLQRDAKIAVFGTADTGEKMTVSLNGQKAGTTAKDGKWVLYLNPIKAGGPYEMIIQGNNKIELKNILIGDVWLCGGQSNMDFDISKFLNSNNHPEESEKYQKIVDNSGKYPELRMILINKNKVNPPLDDMEVESEVFKGSWQAGSPDLTPSMTATGYVFGLRLQEYLNIPIGLIDCNKGGTPVEVWMSSESLKKVGKDPDIDTYYGGMLKPIIPFTIKGVIWYQGESNAKGIENAFNYEKTFKTMITGWRKEWGIGDFPFIFVQLAAFDGKPLAKVTWPVLRESQSKSLTLPNTGMASAIDTGEEKNIHPIFKITISERLAAAAKHVAYGKDIIYTGPTYKEVQFKDNKAIISFEHTGSGLVTKTVKLDSHEIKGDSPVGFEICGSDEKFIKANVEIKGNKVIVSHPDIKKPEAVRYAWTGFPMVNLYNKEGFPANPFRTDNYEIEMDKKAARAQASIDIIRKLKALPGELKKLDLSLEQKEKILKIHDKHYSKEVQRKQNRTIGNFKNISKTHGKNSEQVKKWKKENNAFMKPIYKKILEDVLKEDILTEEQKLKK